jgi:hypothetical protein
MRGCGWCGNPGHDEGQCDIKRRDARKTPFGNQPRPNPRAVSDPADRDATEHTVFLTGAKD